MSSFPMTFDWSTRILPLGKYFVLIEYIPARRMWNAVLYDGSSIVELSKCDYSTLVQLCLAWDSYNSRGGK